MARTVDTIKALIYAEMAKKPVFDEIMKNPSQVKFWGELVHTAAVEMALHEQLMDYHLELKEAENSESVFNADWLKARILEFQYSATTPQVLSLNADLEPVYAIVNTALRIITHVVLYFDATRLLHVKVAKGSPPAKLSAGELTAFQSFLTDGGNSTTFAVGMGFVGVAMIGVSLDPDYIWFEAEIRHTEEVTATVQAAVILAIKNYYYSLEADGYLRTVSLLNAIQAVEGITDVMVINLAIRSNAEAFGSKHHLVQANVTVVDQYQAAAGYAYEEITASEDLATKLTFKVA